MRIFSYFDKILVGSLLSHFNIIKNYELLAENGRKEHSSSFINLFMTLMKPTLWFLTYEVEFPDTIIFKNVKILVRNNQSIKATVIHPKNKNAIDEVFLVLHGKGTNRFEFIKLLTPENPIFKNSMVIIPDYRGFYDSDGKFTPENSSEDIAACVKYLQNARLNCKITIIGHSLGAALALNHIKDLVNLHNQDSIVQSNEERRYIMQNIGIKRVVLVSPFYSFNYTCDTLNSGFKNMIIRFLFHNANDYGYRSYENIRCLHPDDVLIISGKQDQSVSWRNSQRLSEENNCKVFFVDRANHKDILGYTETIQEIFKFIKE